MSNRRIWSVVMSVVFLLGGVARAQVTAGAISGTVRDSSGAILSGAKVTVLNEDTGSSRTFTTDAVGHYSALSLSLGNYRITATLQGFQTLVHTGVVVNVGQDAIVDLSLPVGTAEQSVNVTEKPPLIESTTGSLTNLVDASTIRDLPLNGRSFDQLATIQPGVTSASPGAPTVGNTFSFGTGQRFSVNGQRANTNLFLMDGMNINDQANATPGGAAGTNLGVDTILEFRTYTNGFKAEFGHSMGSVTAAVTRSGSNQFHGTAFEYIRNSALDASNYFDTGKQPSFKRNQFGGVFGGPIKKDKMFFFAGYEGLRQGLGTTLFATVPTDNARAGNLPSGPVTVNPTIVPYLNIYPHVNGRDFGDGSGQYVSAKTIVTNEDNVMGRYDYVINASNTLFVRFTYDDDSVVAPQAIPAETQVATDSRKYSTINYNHIFTPNLLNNVRAGYNSTYNTNDMTYDSTIGPSLSFIPGQRMGAIQLGAIGTSGSRALTALGPSTGNGPFFWDFSTLQGSDDLNWTKGHHSFKFGTDIQHVRDDFTNNNSLQGVYTFADFTHFLQGVASNLQASSPLSQPYDLGFRQLLFAFYAQDDWQVSPRLTLNLGLRYEATTDAGDAYGKTAILPTLASPSTVKNGSYYTSPKKNFQPRIGVAWAPTASGKTMVRAALGIYQNQILPYIYENQGRVPPFGGNLSATNPTFPNGAATLSAASQTSFLVMNYHEMTPTDYQYNLSVQHQLPGNSLVQVAYAGSVANHLQTQKEGNTPIPTIQPDGTPLYTAGAPRRNPAYGGIRYFDSNGRARYDSVTVMLKHDSAHGLIGQVFYTFSKTMDDASASSSAESQRSPAAIKYPDCVKCDWALSDYSQKHALVGYMTYPLPFHSNHTGIVGALANHWTVNSIAQFRSGLPFTPILGATRSLNQSVAPNAETPNLIAGFSNNPTSGRSAGCTGFLAGTPVGVASNWFNPCAFSLPALGTYGNLKRNTIIGPRYADMDLALQKDFHPTARVHTTFKAELFNIFNHPNFGLPNVTALASSGAANPSAGTITYTVTSSRQLQFALKIGF